MGNAKVKKPKESPQQRNVSLERKKRNEAKTREFGFSLQEFTYLNMRRKAAKHATS